MAHFFGNDSSSTSDVIQKKKSKTKKKQIIYTLDSLPPVNERTTFIQQYIKNTKKMDSIIAEKILKVVEENNINLPKNLKNVLNKNIKKNIDEIEHSQQINIEESEEEPEEIAFDRKISECMESENGISKLEDFILEYSKLISTIDNYEKEGEKQQGEKQQGEKQQGEEQQGEIQGEKQQGEEQQGEEQQGEKQQGKEQQGEKQQGKEQQGEIQGHKQGKEHKQKELNHKEHSLKQHSLEQHSLEQDDFIKLSQLEKLLKAKLSLFNQTIYHINYFEYKKCLIQLLKICNLLKKSVNKLFYIKMLMKTKYDKSDLIELLSGIDEAKKIYFDFLFFEDDITIQRKRAGEKILKIKSEYEENQTIDHSLDFIVIEEEKLDEEYKLIYFIRSDYKKAVEYYKKNTKIIYNNKILREFCVRSFQENDLQLTNEILEKMENKKYIEDNKDMENKKYIEDNKDMEKKKYIEDNKDMEDKKYMEDTMEKKKYMEDTMEKKKYMEKYMEDNTEKCMENKAEWDEKLENIAIVLEIIGIRPLNIIKTKFVILEKNHLLLRSLNKKMELMRAYFLKINYDYEGSANIIKSVMGVEVGDFIVAEEIC
ncbi:hypothetical protein M153_310005516 [Pseudoloma neurophilia]|uniref:Uncharacterized protein n=1 Tax=Pseudoloma neurophilia TaxID=146866 RepID=A0A0R0M7M5_9MICR|nr:hypothetical protein M153_310005516 [Pseudoloma neurophilia]